jgi:hypothetical protein
MSERIQGANVPRPIALFLLAVLFTSIALPALLLYQIPSKLDPAIWLWGGILIIVIFAISIPIALWRQRTPPKPLRPPWPTAQTNPLFGNAIDKHTTLTGDFNWTPKLFNQMARTYLRFTPAGRQRRRTTAFLAALGLAGVAAGIGFSITHELGGLALLIASLVLLALAYSETIRPPARLQARVQWQLSGERLLLTCSESEALAWCQSGKIHWQSIRAILRTPAGFIIWPMNPIEVLLPNQAFASADQLETFARIARSRVFNYVDVEERHAL